MICKKIIPLLSLAVLIGFLNVGCSLKKETETEKNQVTLNISENRQALAIPKVEKKADLYSSTAYELPLFSIVEISKLHQDIKDKIDTILEESQGFYLLRKDDDNVLIILQNPVKQGNTYSRHDLQFVEIDMNGNLKYHIAGYQGVEGETVNSIIQADDEWLYESSSKLHRPIKHIAYDEKGKVKFIEIWSYDEDEPVKYQMKDAHKKVVSILKESQDNDSNFRKEHIFYDNEGKIRMSLTVNYDGAEISRVTYYNSHDTIDSMSIITEYENGLKVKELVYNEDYELINTVIADYIDGERKSIKVLDNNGEELIKI